MLPGVAEILFHGFVEGRFAAIRGAPYFELDELGGIGAIGVEHGGEVHVGIAAALEGVESVAGEVLDPFIARPEVECGVSSGIGKLSVVVADVGAAVSDAERVLCAGQVPKLRHGEQWNTVTGCRCDAVTTRDQSTTSEVTELYMSHLLFRATTRSLPVKTTTLVRVGTSASPTRCLSMLSANAASSSSSAPSLLSRQAPHSGVRALHTSSRRSTLLL